MVYFKNEKSLPIFKRASKVTTVGPSINSNAAKCTEL